MATFQASGARTVAAPADRVYAILCDYHEGHRAILPPQYFTDLRIDEGGVGAGTKLTVTMRAMGKEQSAQFVVTEPDPGRVLKEADPDGGLATTFTLEPVGDGSQTHVLIETVGPTRGGLAGKVEGWVTRRFLQRVYAAELDLLADYVTQPASIPA